MLGRGKNEAFLYDRGGGRLLGRFEDPVKIIWGRTLDDVSTASVLMSVTRSNCDWLGEIRAGRHELVIFRTVPGDEENSDPRLPQGQRVWEGPVTRPLYGPDSVEVLARDVLYPTTRRVHRGRFTDPTNGVSEVEAALRDAYRYDDPNVLPWLEMRTDGAPLVTTAVNRADQTYWDGIGDILDQGVHITTVGRRVVSWSTSAVLSQTTLLRSEEALNADVNVVEDGLSLATRSVLTGGDTYGASSPEPEIVNWATDPDVEDNTTGWKVGKWFTVTLLDATWGAGRRVGLAVAKPPTKGSKKAATFAAELQAFDQTDVVLLAQPQAIAVHQGEDLSATLMVRGQGATSRYGRIGLRLVGINSFGQVSDRAFAEGPPVVLGADHVPQQLFVTGTVPADTVKAFVEVFRDTNYVKPVLDAAGNPVAEDKLTDAQKEPVKWKAGDGFAFDKFGWWRGRIEPWFNGSTPADATFTYAWTGGPGASTSVRTLRDPASYVDPYYGLVEDLARSDATTRPDLEAAARQAVRGAYPAPLAVNVGQNAPLRPDAPVSIEELVAGATVPLQVTTTCREIVAATVIDGLTVTQDSKGEQVTVSLVSAAIAAGPEPEPEPLPPVPTASDVAAMLKANRVGDSGLTPEEFVRVVIGQFVTSARRYIDKTLCTVDFTRADPVRLVRASVGHRPGPSAPTAADKSAMLRANELATSIPGESEYEPAVVGAFIEATHRYIDGGFYDVDYRRKDPVRLTVGSAPPEVF